MNAHSRVTTNEMGVVVEVEPSITALLGWTPEQMKDRRIGELAHPDDLKYCLKSWVHMRQSGGDGSPLRFRCRHMDGHWVWIDLSYRNLLATRGEVLMDMVDVSREVELVELVSARDQILARMSEVGPIGVFLADLSGRLRYANGRLEAMTGVHGAGSLGEQLAAVAGSERPRFTAAVGLAREGTTTAVEVMTDEGRWSVSLSPMVAPTGTVKGVVGCVEDKTNAAPQAPTYDPVTGALTRDATLSALGELVRAQAPLDALPAENRRRDDVKGTACIVIRLGALEAFTAQHGREARDELLSLVGLRVRDSVRSSDLLGRTGEDELAVLCSKVPGTTSAFSISHAILSQVTQPMTLSAGISLTVQPGMGIDWTADPSSPADQMLARAERAALESATSTSPEPLLAASPDATGARLAALATAAKDASVA